MRVLGLTALAGLHGALPFAGNASAADTHGRVNPPQPAPAIDLRLHDGSASSLAALLRGHTTALQFMFTGCSATCPIQGAVFAQLQTLVATPALSNVQLVSLSIDTLGDSPATLARWLKTFDAGRQWRAAVPAIAHAQRVSDWVGARAGGRDSHTTAVLLFDPQARLVWRTLDMPDPAEVARLLGLLEARRAG